jgi:CHAD domain-containing protein
MPFYILQHEPVAPALRRIAHEQIDIATGNFADDAVPADKQVHGLRARCKKMRGLLRLQRPLMGEVFEVQDQRVRAAAKLLGAHREAEVLAKTIEALGGSSADFDVRPEPIPEATISRSLTIMAVCRSAVDNWPRDIKGFDDLAPGFSRTYQECLDIWDATRRSPSDENYHELRKKTKYHWHHVRVLERINKREIRKRRKKLRDLQLSLGDAHDLAVLQTFLEASNNRDTDLLQRANARKRELYAHIMQVGHKVYETPVDELVDNYSRWWASSRELPQPGA